MAKGSQGRQQGGIPDGLVLALVGLPVGLTVLAWTATGLAALLSKGAWPDGVTFTRTPTAVRSLLGRPQDLAAAWPETPAGELSGYGLFWGLLIGELMVLVVLTVFVVGTLARWRTVRTGGRGAHGTKATAARTGRTEAHEDEEEPYPADPMKQPPAPRRPLEEPPQPPTTAQTTASAPTPAVAPVPAAAATAAAEPAARGIVYGTPSVRRPAAVQAVQDAEGPVLVVTSDPAVWADTKDARGKLGPVLVYDPGHLCDTPARLHWSPSAGCEDPATAQERAVALLAPVRPPSRLDAAVADTAETLLRCWLHAAALDDRPFKQVHRWAQGTGAHEPVRILRTHPKAASGHAGLLESALTAHPERREIAQELTARALSALSSIHIRDACTPNRTDSLTLESFVAEGGTLYVVGETIEDPRTSPGAMPLLTGLAASVVEHGRRMAARSSDGRLDPPLTLVLDDVAAVAPLPQLPELLAAGQDIGLPTLALLRSQEQARARWPEPLPQP
ncbi:type IV secretory system conjugative DNA transfer family protein [Streptomyces sp. Je 1-79]|uniref:type IV secretory system conjugative DNA transfer family protein n=1 Tax=Streptomyces sp. Je 1-79 TaxID=2943847 RepID=UPI0021A724AB|nr:type IV secretory system conjugative DNA transfer family protein [Streptomyces sp. Je 1-79]MCT4356994.1 type IV secretory system conjugative DNA transfer family protein [Streptomyces sp. Je 1-79]